MARKVESFDSQTNVNLRIPVDVGVKEVAMLVNGKPAQKQRFVKITAEKLKTALPNAILINLGTTELHRVVELQFDPTGKTDQCDVTIHTMSGPKTLPLKEIQRALLLVESY